MQFNELLHATTVYIDHGAHSKTAVLLRLSQLLSDKHPELNAELLFDAYWKRESLGSTTIGHGVIIPHIRSVAITKTYGCFIKLKNPVDFGAADKQPVDLVLGLVVPQQHTEQHLKTLTEIIKLFSAAEFRQACRQTNDCAALYALLTHELLPSPSQIIETAEL